MIFDYINDREESGHKLSESCVMAFLGTIDFVSISRGALLNDFIPRAEKLLSPSYALVLNDFTGFNYPPLITRCAYSMQMLSPSKGLCPSYPKVAVLSCGNIVSEDSVESMLESITSMLSDYRDMDNCSDGMKITIRCPFCKSQRRDEDDGRVHCLGVQRKREWCCDYNEYYTLTDDRNIEDKIELKFGEIEPSRLFFDRKDAKIAALTHWITSEGDSEDENATAETAQKRSRGDSSSLLQSKGLFVRVLNQCSEMKSEKIFFHIIGSPDWRVMSTIEAFAKILTAIPADMISHPSQGIGLFRYEPNGYSLGERLEPDSKWNEIGFNLQGGDEELIVARHLQTAGKPVIRIYSDVVIKNMEVSVDLEDMFDALTYPLALVEEKDVKNTSLTWTVDVHPRETTRDHSSIIQHKQHDESPLREYSYLFWEASAKKEFLINLSNASCVRSADLSTGVLQDALLAQGLSTDEATEMATHWLPALTKKTFALIEFLPTKELDKMAKLRVYPVPSRIHRVFMLFMSTDTDHSCNTPLVRSPAMVLSREGCSVVEWGGMECF